MNLSLKFGDARQVKIDSGFNLNNSINTRESTVLGQLSKVRQLIYEIFNNDSLTMTEIRLLDSLIKVAQNRKSVIDTCLQGDISENESLLLLAESQRITQEISFYISNLNVLMLQLNEERKIKIDSAISFNNSISPTEVIEENEQIFYGIFFDKLVYGNYNLDSTQVANNDYIATQCPFSGGRFVFCARAVKRILGDTTIYDDSTACIGAGARLAHKSTKDHDRIIQVFPNPVNESCTFRYRLVDDEHGKIEIYNLLYEKIDEIVVKPKSSSLTYFPKNLKCGLYLYRYISNDKIVGSGKMAIIK